MSTSPSPTVNDQSAPSVALPRRRNQDNSTKPPVWPIDNALSSETTPLQAKCARSEMPDGVCCKQLKEDERQLIDPDVVRDVIIGLSDGLTVPFALTAGLSSLGTSRIVVLGGVAELIAGAISMGIGGFLASQAERDHYRYLKNQTAHRVIRSCAGEMEREVEEVLGPVGVDQATCRAVAKSLREAGGEEDTAPEARASNDEENASSLRWSKDVGLTAFLLKFGEGMEEVPTRRLYISAFTIGMGYLIGGLIPLLPYFLIPNAQVALMYSCIVTGLVLLIFGAIKAQVTGASNNLGGIVWGAVSTLLVGGLAAGAAFGIVKALEGQE
ncbi:membrane fraction protein [Moniliophthora roreri]|uniref:Putative membrane fraction protein n=1 Tax=Moniliophthora roreri TaxID=221103 RepID=A0A0W0F144_MONRR|nr:membrane fraction protein [Moniliophthora roreri]